MTADQIFSFVLLNDLRVHRGLSVRGFGERPFIGFQVFIIKVRSFLGLLLVVFNALVD